MTNPGRMLLAAILTNASMGILYVWSLFLIPLESTLFVSRTTLSIVPGVALVMFTAGMFFHMTMVRKIGLRRSVILTFALASGGHILFGLWPSYATLLAGYGVTFGFACGAGYGIALVFAARTPAAITGIAVGITVASFALSGIVLSSILPALITTSGPGYSFTAIAIGLLLVGVVVCLLSTEQDPTARPVDNVQDAPQLPIGELLLLGVFFFVLCYPGLMLIAHSTAILTERGVAPDSVYYGPIFLNAAYIFGSLLGGVVAQRIPARPLLTIAFIIEVVGIIALWLSSSVALTFIAMLLVGLIFGGSASLMPMLIAERFGKDAVGFVYGRLMIGYGLAGLSAPWVTAALFTYGDTYASAFVVTAILVAVGLATNLATKD